METRVAVLGIIVEDPDSVARLNEVLHENADIIIGRMGIPYPKRHMNVISVAVDAPQDTITRSSSVSTIGAFAQRQRPSHSV